MASRLVLDEVNEDCVRWLEENGDQGEAVGTIGKTKIESVEALVADASERNDREDYIRYTIELAALNWINFGNDKKKYRARSKKMPHFRFKGRAATLRFLTYLRAIERLSENREPLPDWARTALLERWRPPPGWKP